MEEIKAVGVIQDKQSKEGNTNGKDWKRFMFKIGEKSFSTFNSDLDEFKVGDNVAIVYTVSGIYNNLVSMEESESAPTMPAQVATSAPAKTNYTDKSTEVSIVSQVIIKAVTEMVSAGKIETGAFKANAIVLADVYKTLKKELVA